MASNGGFLQVGINHDRTGHIVFSPAQARAFARLLQAKAQEAEQAIVIDVQCFEVVN
jgi:hypothetical protein